MKTLRAIALALVLALAPISASWAQGAPQSPTEPAGTTATPAASPTTSATPSANATAAAKKPKQPLTAEGDARLLGQSWSWFRPNGVGPQPSYSVLGIRLRARLKYDNPGVRGLAELQDTQVTGLVPGSARPAPVGPMGIGGAYYLHAQRPSINTAGVRQAWLSFGDPKVVTGTVGRFEYSSGVEMMSGDKTLDWLLRVRLRERLVGPFDFTDYGRTFDGFRVDVSAIPGQKFTVFASHPTQGGFEPHFADEIPQITTTNAAWTIQDAPKNPTMQGQIFWNQYCDIRNVPQVDNRPIPLRGRINAQGGLNIASFGGHFISKIGSRGDALAWFVQQTGRWGTLTHSATAYNVELGLKVKAPWNPWLRAGYYYGSGDANPLDNKHGTFFSPLPTVRVLARFPFYNFSNVQDAFAQIMLAPSSRTNVRLDVHALNLANSNDLWYFGSGATQARGSINGYLGRPSGGSRSLGTLFDISIDHKFSDTDNVQLYFGTVSGGRVVSTTFPQNTSANWFYIDYTHKFQ